MIEGGCIKGMVSVYTKCLKQLSDLASLQIKNIGLKPLPTIDLMLAIRSYDWRQASLDKQIIPGTRKQHK